METAEKVEYTFDVHHVTKCNFCGSFKLSGSTYASLENGQDKKEIRQYLSYLINLQRYFDNSKPTLTSEMVRLSRKSRNWPNPHQLGENLIYYLANFNNPGKYVSPTTVVVSRLLGAKTPAAMEPLTESLVNEGLLVRKDGSHAEVALTLEGWRHIDELKKGKNIDSSLVFMAMGYGDEEIDNFIDVNFGTAVLNSKLGLKLERLDSNPEAGVLDNRMQLMIKKCRLLIADVTTNNRGVYWEAGYAYGLGKPVIYTCRKEEFESEEKRPHFDIDHHQAVIWDPNHPEKAQDELKIIIQNTLFEKPH